MTGVHLLLFAAAVSVLAPRMLAGAGWVYRAPRLGIAAWYAVLAAFVSAVAGAVVAVLAPWQATNAPICAAWRWCVQAARGEFGVAGRAVAALAAVVGLVLAVRLVVTAVRLGRAAARRRRAHALMLAVAGRRQPHLDATVIDDPRPAAYLVAGRRRRVVVTTGALNQLTDEEVAAVLAHERAHATGRHALLLDAARLLHRAFPRMVLFTIAHAQLARLVELRADELATREHSRISLARALVAVASATATDEPVPGGLAGAVPAAGGDAAERLHRLLAPPDPLSGLHRRAVAMALAALAVTPPAILAAAQLFPVLGMCPVLSS